MQAEKPWEVPSQGHFPVNQHRRDTAPQLRLSSPPSATAPGWLRMETPASSSQFSQEEDLVHGTKGSGKRNIFFLPYQPICICSFGRSDPESRYWHLVLWPQTWAGGINNHTSLPPLYHRAVPGDIQKTAWGKRCCSCKDWVSGLWHPS